MSTITLAGTTFEQFVKEPHKVTYVDIDNNSDTSNSVSLSRVLPAKTTGAAKARFKFQSDVSITRNDVIEQGRVYLSLDITAPTELSTADRTRIVNDFIAALSDETVLACLQKGVL